MRRSRPPRPATRLARAGLACALAVWVTGHARADSTDERLLDGLRSRRLYELAEDYCETRLSRTDVPELERLTLAIELSKTLVEHALDQPAETRPIFWDRALVSVAAELAQLRDHPRGVLLETQRGLIELARGESAVQEVTLADDDARALDEARSHLRASIRALDDAASKIEELLREVSLGFDRSRPAWTAGELQSLARNVDYQLARAYRDQARSYPQDSADRANSLGVAIEKLRPLSEIDTSEPLAWRAQLDLATCLRLQGDGAETLARLDALDERQPPPDVLLASRAERARLALDSGDVDRALAVLEAGRAIQGVTSPELDFCHLEATVAAWSAADRADQSERAAELERRAAAMIAEIDHLYGAYWRRRAELLLARNVSSGGGLDDPAILIRAAEGFFRSDQFDEAVSAYDRAAARHAELGQADKAFDAAYTAAAIEQSRKRWTEAAARFRKLALARSDHDRAGAAHLLAIYNTAQAARENPASAAEYMALLNEHLARFPRGASTDQARIWLGKVMEHQQSWEQAAAAYRDVDRHGAKRGEALDGMLRAYRGWLDRLRREGRSTESLSVTAAEQFERLALDDNGDIPTRWTAEQRGAALAAAELLLRHSTGQADRAARVLQAALAGGEDAAADWRSNARSLLLLALASQGRREEAAQLVSQVSAAGAADLLSLVEGLSSASASAGDAAARDLASIQLEVAAILARRRNELDADQRRRLDLGQAAALARVGRRAECRGLLDDLATRFPKDGDIHETRAKLVADIAREDPQLADEAYSLWLDVERKSRKGTSRWFRAIIALVELNLRRGERAKAADLIRATEIAYPELGGSEMKEQFRRLGSQIAP